MNRIIVFGLFIIALFSLLNISNSYKLVKISNEKFSLSKLEEQVALSKKLEEEKRLKHLAEHSPGEKGDSDESNSPKKPVLALDTPQLVNGNMLFEKKGKCVTCHGFNGEGRKSQESPKIGGQYEWYLNKQLLNMKNKVRKNPKMDPYLKNLTEEDIKDISHYLSKLPFPN